MFNMLRILHIEQICIMIGRRSYFCIFFTALTCLFFFYGSHVFAGSCQEAIRFYNEATGVKGLIEKERLFTYALASGCSDKKIVAKIRNNLADTYEKQGRIEKAIAEYHKASKADPALPTPYLSLGDIYTRLNRPKDADRFYEKGFLVRNYKSTNDIVESLSPERAIRVKPKTTLYFGFDQAGLSKEAERQLEALGRAFKNGELLPYRFCLEGHTCSSGTRKYNQALSEQRAKAVRGWMVAHGISEDRLMIMGFGEDRPVADNSSEEGRRYNRRVKVRTVGIAYMGNRRSVHSYRQKEAFALLKEGERLIGEERYETAIGLFKKAHSIFEKEKSIEGVKAALKDLTLAYRFLGDWKKAEYYRGRWH